MSDAATGLAGFSIILGLLALVVIVLWILLPFAVFGLKGIVREVLAEQRKTNELLQRAEAARRPAAPGSTS